MAANVPLTRHDAERAGMWNSDSKIGLNEQKTHTALQESPKYKVEQKVCHLFELHDFFDHTSFEQTYQRLMREVKIQLKLNRWYSKWIDTLGRIMRRSTLIFCGTEYSAERMWRISNVRGKKTQAYVWFIQEQWPIWCS